MKCRKGAVGQLFDDGGKFLQALTSELDLCFQLSVVCYSQMLVP
jgi:hypothetical protein